MYYHASPVEGITELQPRVSNHKTPFIYFSKKRENVLVYLSNAVEKYCKETGFPYDGIWQKWASYGFDKDGIQRIEEYYPDALEKTYQGISGYIYTVEDIDASDFELQIPDAVASSTPAKVSETEYVPDAYLAILEAEQKGLVRILRYEEMTEKHRVWLKETIKKEYESSENQPDYRHFLRGNFPDLIEK
jgi:hypothetical protein